MSRLDDLLARHGMIARGGVAFEAGEEVPAGPSGAPANGVILVGHGGGTIWPHFSQWLIARTDPPANPLDAWSTEVLDTVAESVGARAVYPFEKPYFPFQRWAMRAEALRPSPLGILMHPEFGLWHAYRGALLFEGEIPIQPPVSPIHLCDICDGKPCMNSCPAEAVRRDGMDIARCHAWLKPDAGQACRGGGCLARNACPHDRYRYDRAQTAFHMAAHLRNLGD